MEISDAEPMRLSALRPLEAANFGARGNGPDVTTKCNTYRPNVALDWWGVYLSEADETVSV